MDDFVFGGLYDDDITCSCGKPSEPGICPYDADIKGIETICHCCPDCRDAHAQEI